MAEIMVLLLFVLLLLFGLRLRREGGSGNVKPVPEFPGSRVTLGDVVARAGIPPGKIPDDFTELVVGGIKFAEAVRNLGVPVTKANAEELAKDTILGKQVRQGLGPNRVGQTPEDAARDFATEAERRYTADSSGQGGPGSSSIWLGGLEQPKAVPGGPGGVLPPCARTAAGKAALVLTTELFDGHVVVSDNDIDSLQRTAPAAVRFFEGIQRGTALSDATFLAQTQDAFEWSVAQKCRFYVYVVDKTGAGAKMAYKQRLATVEGHFYKLLGGAGGGSQN
jgi:hypothetical protein